MTSGSKPCECLDLGGSNDAAGWLEIAGQVTSGQGQYHTYLCGPEPYSRPTFCCALPVALHHQNHCSIATDILYLGEAPQTQLSVRSLGQLSLGLDQAKPQVVFRLDFILSMFVLTDSILVNSLRYH